MNKKRRKRRKNKNKGLIRLIIVLVILIVGIFLLINSPLFKITERNVEGNNRVSSEDIILSSNIVNGDSFIFFDKEEVENNVKKLPLIEDVRVRRNFPNKITIEVSERQPAASVQFSNKYILVDRFGYIIGENESVLVTLTQITGALENREILLGDLLFNYVDEQKKELLQLIFNGENIYKYKDINLSDDRAQMILKDGVEIAFGSYNNSKYKLDVIDQMLQSVAGDSSKNAAMILMEEGPNPILVYD